MSVSIVSFRRHFSHSDAEKLYARLRTYDFISFDIFDTLVKRDVPTPSSVFEVVDLLYRQKTSQCLNDFVQARRNAEIRARKCSSGKEITLCEIYQMLPYNKETAEELQKLEAFAEYMLCTANRPILEIYKRLLADKKEIYLVSDMYLPRQVIVAILEKCEIRGYKGLYLSNENRARKRNGLFDVLLQNEGLRNQMLVHVGDDLKADCIPLILKKRYSAYMIPHQIANVRLLSDRRERLSLSKQIIDCFINNHMDSDWGYFKQAGFYAFGPLLFSFMQWLKEQIKCRNINNILFLERDGYVMEKAWDLLSTKTDGCKKHSVYLSRVSILPTRLEGDYSVSNILKTIPHRQNSTVTMVLKRVGLYTEENIALAKSTGIDLEAPVGEKLSESGELYRYLQKAMKDLPQKYAEEAERFENYILQYIGDGDRAAIVDVGWNGTAQKAIKSVLKNCGIQAELFGFYWGLNRKALGREGGIDARGYLVDEDSPAIDRANMKACMGFIEFFLTAPYGMTIGYHKTDELIEPVLEEYEYKNQDGSLREEASIIEDLQEGALYFIKQLIRSGIDSCVEPAPAEALMGLRQLCVYPHPADLKLWGDTYNFENSLIPFAQPKSIMYYLKNMADLRKDFGDATWKLGFLRRLLHNLPVPYFQIYQFLLKAFHK